MKSTKKTEIDYKDVKNIKDLKVFIDKAFEPICKNPEKLVEVLKKAWGDQGEEKGGSGSGTEPESIRDLFPNYTPPSWDEIRDEVELVEFPPGSAENPFNPLSKGKYFIYLTNRAPSISYLGKSIEDFEERNSKLYKNVQKGYTNLWVFQRVFLITSKKTEFQWEAKLDLIDKSYDEKQFCLFRPGGLYLKWKLEPERVQFKSFEKAVLYAKKHIEDSGYPLLCGMRISNYSWH